LSDFTFYADGIDGKTLVYSATEDTGFDIDNIQDRNINTLFKDTAIGAASVTIDIDFGAAKTCDYLLLGTYLISTDTDDLKVKVEHDNDSGYGSPTTVYDGTGFEGVTNHVQNITSGNERYWRITFYDAAAGDLVNMQIGNILLGARFDLANNPELIPNLESGYIVDNRETPGGFRRSNISNTTIRKTWDYRWKNIAAAEKTNYETWRDLIYMSNGLSHYPFYFTDDNATTLYYGRTRGKLKFSEQSYQAYELGIRIEEEL
jgi:hypothetical protein